VSDPNKCRNCGQLFTATHDLATFRQRVSELEAEIADGIALAYNSLPVEKRNMPTETKLDEQIARLGAELKELKQENPRLSELRDACAAKEQAEAALEEISMGTISDADWDELEQDVLDATARYEAALAACSEAQPPQGEKGA